MFCTGGIRCEKSTSLLLQEGFSEVYHLKGGILKYLEETPAEESIWEGECFVFDGHTAVTHGVERRRKYQMSCIWLAFIPKKKLNYQAMNMEFLVFSVLIKLQKDDREEFAVCVNHKLQQQNANAYNL